MTIIASLLGWAVDYKKHIAIIVVVLAVFAYHKNATRVAYKDGRASILSEQAIIAGKAHEEALKNQRAIDDCRGDAKCLRAKDANQRD